MTSTRPNDQPATIPVFFQKGTLKSYLAFPLGTSLTAEEKLNVLQQERANARAEEQERKRSEELSKRADARESAASDEAWKERKNQDLERRRAREVRERAEALIGEMDWVRSGGVLRDANGRRDYARTEEVRKLVEEHDRQCRAIARWEKYEAGWSALLSSNEPVSFSSVPWPTISPPATAAELHDKARIAEFLFESLSVKGNAVTRKDRLRVALKRWHPDKLGGVLARVQEEDVVEVKDGIDAVVIGLMKLQEELKTERG